MRSWQIVEWGKPLEVREYPNPEPTGKEVLMRVGACGVCHSDLHIWQGFFDLGGGQQLRIADRGVKLPFTMGHEVVGEVVSVGPEAQGVEPGDKRVIYPWIGCGKCEECARGEDLLCLQPRIVGTWRHGGYSDHVIVPDGKYLVDYEGVSEDLACTYACSGITALSALKKAEIDAPDKSLLMIGAGGVGLQALNVARAILPGKLGVADVDPGKRAHASKGGAHFVVDNAGKDAAQSVKEWSQGGVHAAIDFVGRPETTQFGISCLRKGGTMIVVGLYGGRLEMPLPSLPLRMYTLRGSYVGTLADLVEVIDLAKAGKLSPIDVQPRGLDEVNRALDDLAAGRVSGRVVLRP